jgi:hypothetical protein
MIHAQGHDSTEAEIESEEALEQLQKDFYLPSDFDVKTEDGVTTLRIRGGLSFQAKNEEDDKYEEAFLYRLGAEVLAEPMLIRSYIEERMVDVHQYSVFPDGDIEYERLSSPEDALSR